MSPAKRRSSVFQFLLIFILVYLITQSTFKYFFPEEYGEVQVATGVTIEAQDKTVKGQHHPLLVIKNKSEKDLLLDDRCPLPPVDVWKINEGEAPLQLFTEETALPCTALTVIKAGESQVVDLAPWKYSLFDEYGTYEVELPVSEGVVAGTSQYREGVVARFSIYEVGTATQLFRTFITKPLLNFLILIASYLPGYNLGLAIIIITIIIKLILFIPTQHAMEGQKKMQDMQPKMDELKKKHKEDPKKLQEATMRLWKENKVNPMQSFLPMLIQFPILIGLFFTIRDGSILALSEHLLYGPYQDLPWTFGTNFLGIDLNTPNIYIFPPMLMVMQFIQMKMSFAISKKKEEKSGKTKKKDDNAPMSQQEMQQKMMMYGLPLMIGFFALQFPSAVSLYWGISTLFAIGQQLVVNRKVL